MAEMILTPKEYWAKLDSKEYCLYNIETEEDGTLHCYVEDMNTNELFEVIYLINTSCYKLIKVDKDATIA